MNAATSIGLEPVDRNAPKNSQYVRNLTPEEQNIFDRRERRQSEKLNINNSEITQETKIAEIKEAVSKSEHDKDLCKDITEFSSMKDVYAFIKTNAEIHGVYTLSSPPPYKGMPFE